jgi:hypothetical protein
MAIAAAALVLLTGCELVTFSDRNELSLEEIEATRAEAAEYAAPSLLDPRIDLTLTRADVDCSEDNMGGGEDTRTVTAHFVVDGKLGKACLGPTNTTLVEAWKQLVAIATPNQLRDVAIFSGYSNNDPIPAENSSIGYAKLLAPGFHSSTIAIDLDHAFSNQARLAQTLTHEMGHVMTFTYGTWTPMRASDRCLGFARNSICFNADSMMQAWVDQFWGDDAHEIDWSVSPVIADGIARCRIDPSFLTPYAATNPLEDLAESYEAYVLREDIHTPQQQAKMDFFGDYPEAVEARARATQLGFGPYPLADHCGR